MDNLITSASDLPTMDEMGLIDSNVIQVNCQRTIDAENFGKGVQDFVFNCSMNQRFQPNKSYFRMRLSLSDDQGNAPSR